MAEFMAEDADFAILRFGGVREYLNAVVDERGGQSPFVGPDHGFAFRGNGFGFGAAAGMDEKDAIDEAVAVGVKQGEAARGAEDGERVLEQAGGIIREGVAGAALAVR